MEIRRGPAQENIEGLQEDQCLKVLQMGAQELSDYLENILHENPVLEIEDVSHHTEHDETKLKLEWLETVDAQNKPYYESDAGESTDPMSNYGTVQEEENLMFYLSAQLRLLNLTQTQKQAAQYVVENLDDSGYLRETPREMAACIGLPVSDLQAAVELVRSLEPAGVGAKNLQDCLCLQLFRRGETEDALTVRIVKNHLAAVAERNTAQIARSLQVEEMAVQAACQTIRQLNPRPGAEFSKRQTLIYLNPDVFVVKFPGHFELLTNEYDFPALGISETYHQMLRTTEDPEVREYLSVRMQQAQAVIRGVEQRRNLLLACTQEIVSVQSRFFQEGIGHLVSFPLEEAAQRMGIAENLMELLVHDKYLQCSSGVFPLGYFFPDAAEQHAD